MSDLVGQVVAQYRIDQWIGDGGMGTVYKAFDENLERVAAIKLMHPHFARLPEFRARLAREAKTSAQLDHPSIVRIYDFGEFEDRLFIAMEYISGGNLRSHLTRLQRMKRLLPLEQSLQIGAQIADALDFAHRIGVIHRDVKPGNILLKRLTRPDRPDEQPFRAVLTDFGLVKLVEGQELTESGLTLGTPTYMSPEQCQGEALDGRSDLYSLGVVLYELLTNELPFEFKSLSEAMAVHLRGTMPKLPSSIRPELPLVMDSLLRSTLAKKPEDRFVSGSEMNASLRSAMAAIMGLQTQIYPHVESGELEEFEQDEAAEVYVLLIETPGQPSRAVDLIPKSIQLGRSAENDIILPSDGVSRHHASLEYRSGGWLIRDRGGMNGTWLNNRRLLSEEEAAFETGAKVEIGPYTLLLKRSSPVEAVAAAAIPISEMPTEGSMAVGAAMNVENGDRAQPLALFLAGQLITLVPGRQTIVNAEVVNRGRISDRVNLRIQGLPQNWLKLQTSFSEVPAGESIIIPLVIHPPKGTQTLAGKQRYRVEIQSQQYPDLNLGVNATLNIAPFSSFEVSIHPRQVELPGRLQVEVRNSGNFDDDFSIIGRDAQRIIRFRGERSRVTLKPGQTARVELQLESRKNRWFGGNQPGGFDIEVSSFSGSKQLLSGTVQSSSGFPSTIIYFGVFLIIFLCALAVLFAILRGEFLSGPSSTTVVGVNPGGSATAGSLLMTEAAGTATNQAATQLAATAAVLGDRDGDGLSDTQEEIVGSDPDNRDSDGDSLLDGEEVLTWGTNPLIQDTDADVILDGPEVHQYGTNPTKPDTDGDSIPDGVEIAMGTNPLDPLDPLPTATPTTPETLVPTQIPSSTATDQPTATPSVTMTPLPSDTPTSTPSATPTLEPTETADFVIACTSNSPVIDGQIQVTEWGNGPLFAFSPENDTARSVLVYMDRDPINLYVGYIVSDLSENMATDGVNIAFDSNFNLGDPDSRDRLYQIVRGGDSRVLSGLGNNNDGALWNSDYQSDNFLAITGEPGGNRWVMEMSIDISKEMPDLTTGGLTGHMILISYSDAIGTWPENGDLNNASSWETVGIDTCP